MHTGLILVNGAGGFLGSTVVETLRARGLSIRATDLPGTNLDPARQAGAEVIEADLLDTSSIPRLLEGVKSVVNIAGLFKYYLPWDVLYKANVVVTRNMCEAALKANVKRFIHIASISVYGMARQSPMKEDHPRNPGTDYERSKKEGEDVVFEFVRKGLPAISLRPAGIYGKRSRYGQVSFMAMLALNRHGGTRKIAVMKGGPRVQYVNVEDVAGAIATLLEAPAERVIGKAFNVGDDHPLTQGELFQAVMPVLGLEKSFSYPYFTKAFWPFMRILLALPEWIFDRLNASFEKKWEDVIRTYGLQRMVAPRLDQDFFVFMSGDYILDTSALKSLGWTPKYPDGAQGLAETARWYQEQKWLPRFT